MQCISEMDDSTEWQKIFRKGFEKDRLEAQLEAKPYGARKVLLLVGIKRFGAPEAETYADLMAIKDPDALLELLDKIFHGTSWQDVIQS